MKRHHEEPDTDTDDLFSKSLQLLQSQCTQLLDSLEELQPVAKRPRLAPLHRPSYRQSNAGGQYLTSKDASVEAPYTPSPLAQLPIELVWHIASYLSEPTIIRTGSLRRERRRKFDTCALRLTCRTLKVKTQRVFLKAAFGELEVDLIPTHLDALLEMSKCPEVANAIKCLRFQLDEQWPEDFSDELEEEIDDRNWAERGVASANLSLVMTKFQNLKFIKIDPLHWDRRGYRFASSQSPTAEGSTTRLASIVMSAVTASQTKLERLLFGGYYNHENDDTAAAGCHLSVFGMPARHLEVFDDLREVDLLLAARPSRKFDYRWLDQLCDFLRAAEDSLTSLTLRFDSYPLSETVVRRLRCLAFSNLKSFSLSGAWIFKSCENPIHVFLENHGGLLHIKLSYIDLDTSWANLLELLEEKCQNLITLRLEYVCQGYKQVAFGENQVFIIEESDDTAQSLHKARACLHILDVDLDCVPMTSYGMFRDDSEFSDSD